MKGLFPYADALGIRPEGESPTRLALPPSDAALGRPGFLHGGAITALLEAAGYAGIRHALRDAGDETAQVKPITLTIDFLRGGRPVETFAEARVARLGARIANVAIDAWQEDRERPIASARITFRIRRG